jgi:hypothetical protein
MIRAALWDGIGEFEKRIEIEDAGKIPEVLIVDGVHYIQSEETPRADGSVAYRRAVGLHEVFTQSVPIYVAKLLEDPIVWEAKRIRFFSGFHGAAYTRYDADVKFDKSERIAWNVKFKIKAKMCFEVLGITPFRVNGVWCPEVVRNSDGTVMMADHAAKAVAFARAWQKVQFERPIFRMSAIGVDEYGRMIVDLSKIVPAKFRGPDTHVLFSKPALESGLFLPTRLEVLG